MPGLRHEAVAGERLGELWCAGNEVEGFDVAQAHPGQPGEYLFSRPGELLRCPWHGWEFDIRTGQSWCDPTRVRARPYTVSVQPGTRLVAGPYVAETVPVSVENDYVVVEA